MKRVAILLGLGLLGCVGDDEYSLRMLGCSSRPIAQCTAPGPLHVGDWVILIVDRHDGEQYPAGVRVRSSDEHIIAVERVDMNTDEDWRVTARSPGSARIELIDPAGTVADTIELDVIQ